MVVFYKCDSCERDSKSSNLEFKKNCSLILKTYSLRGGVFFHNKDLCKECYDDLIQLIQKALYTKEFFRKDKDNERYGGMVG